MKNIITIIAAALLLLTAAVVSAEDAHQLIYGASTEISGDFAPGALWTNNVTDALIRSLTNDYDCVASDRGGALMVNPTVCEGIENEMNKDGTKTFTITIKDGLLFNNGEPITIKDFVWLTAFASSPVATELGAKVTTYMMLKGGQEYYNGTAATISGLRMLDDRTFQFTVNADYVPYYFDLAYAGAGASSMKYWLGDAVDLKDDGEGVYFTGLTKEAVEKQLEYARFHAGEDRVTAGPYNLVEYDKGAGQAVLVRNEYYQGNFEGQKPSIDKIIITRAEDATWVDGLKTGAFNFYDSINRGTKINTAIDLIEDEANKAVLGYGYDYVRFDPSGYTELVLQSDFGPTQFPAVRQALAYLMDRNEIANTICQGWGTVVNGPYSSAMWMTQEAEEWLDENLNSYAYDPEKAVELLIEDGWIYDENGNDYVEGIRYKKVTEEEAGSYVHTRQLADGTRLMGLEIEWASLEENAVSDLLSVMLVNGEQTSAVGMKIYENSMTFSEALNYYYRDVSQGEKYGVPTYDMYIIALSIPSLYNMAYVYTTDPELIANGYNTSRLYDEELDRLSMDMVYGVEPGDNEAYLKIWKAFIQRWNELLPEIPLYSNINITVFPDWLDNYDQNSYWGFGKAILYASIRD